MKADAAAAAAKSAATSGASAMKSAVEARAEEYASKLKTSAAAEAACKVRGQGQQFGAEKKSKIWLALNPQSLAFESARERAEKEESREAISSGFGSVAKSYAEQTNKAQVNAADEI